MAKDPTSKPSPEELARRMAWFDDYSSRSDGPPADLPLRCPCCFCRTLGERGGFEICPVCFWEDDGQDEHDADVVRGGPNGGLSLTQACANYRQLGACDARYLAGVRAPRPEESPDENTA
jgi:hypothetical protein